MLGSLVAGATIAGVNNLLSEAHANKAHSRQLELMEKQNAMNKANALSAYSTQVQGLRMAGLNPASLEGAGNPNVSAPVSQGSGAQAENVQMDPTAMLIKAQADNLNADTAKKRAEVGNVNEDTDLKFAQKLFTGANTDKVNQETQNIQNINDTYADTNRSLSEFGRGMAEKWQSSEWYNKLSPQTKDTIDAIASGEMPLTVGGLNALRDVISSQKELSDADRALVQNAFDNAITESMFSDKSIMNAIAREPKVRQAKLRSEIAKLNAELPEIRAKVANLIDDLKTKKLNREDMQTKLDAFKRNDLGYLKSKGEYGKWFEGYAEEMLLRLFPLVSGGAVARGISSPKSAGGPAPNIMPQEIKNYKGSSPIYHIHGVQSFRY